MRRGSWGIAVDVRDCGIIASNLFIFSLERDEQCPWDSYR